MEIDGSGAAAGRAPGDDSSNTCIGRRAVDVPGARPRGVMTFGADLGPLRAVENPKDLPGVVAEVWEQFLATNVTERVKAMAGLIRTLRPDLIGLQEATLIRTQDPGDFFSPNPQPAEHVAHDSSQSQKRTFLRQMAYLK